MRHHRPIMPPPAPLSSLCVCVLNFTDSWMRKDVFRRSIVFEYFAWLYVTYQFTAQIHSHYCIHITRKSRIIYFSSGFEFDALISIHLFIVIHLAYASFFYSHRIRLLHAKLIRFTCFSICISYVGLVLFHFAIKYTEFHLEFCIQTMGHKRFSSNSTICRLN